MTIRLIKAALALCQDYLREEVADCMAGMLDGVELALGLEPSGTAMQIEHADQPPPCAALRWGPSSAPKLDPRLKRLPNGRFAPSAAATGSSSPRQRSPDEPAWEQALAIEAIADRPVATARDEATAEAEADSLTARMATDLARSPSSGPASAHAMQHADGNSRPCLNSAGLPPLHTTSDAGRSQPQQQAGQPQHTRDAAEESTRPPFGLLPAPSATAYSAAAAFASASGAVNIPQELAGSTSIQQTPSGSNGASSLPAPAVAAAAPADIGVAAPPQHSALAMEGVLKSPVTGGLPPGVGALNHFGYMPSGVAPEQVNRLPNGFHAPRDGKLSASLPAAASAQPPALASRPLPSPEGDVTKLWKRHRSAL